MNDAWLCVVLRKRLCRQGEEIVAREMKSIFGADLQDVHLVVEDEMDEESYCFIKCSHPGNYIEELRRSRSIVNVLAHYDSPSYLSDEEVNQFIAQGEAQSQCPVYGDMVFVTKEIPYDGLYGVVVEPDYERSRIMFRLHTTRTSAWLHNENLHRTGSVFDCVKFPFETGNFISGESEDDVSKSQFHRGKHKQSW